MNETGRSQAAESGEHAAVDGIAEMDARRTQREEPFVLDLASNPHPRMRAEAIAAFDARNQSDWDIAYCLGFFDAMAAATGCDLDDLIAWVERR